MRINVIYIIVFISTLQVLTLASLAQQNASSKYFAPITTPSPTVGSLGKYGNLPIDLSTGAATANIPLYDLRLRDNYAINLALNYSSNGVSVDDMAGNVGTDWSFIGSFAIKRTVFDDPDELSADYSRLLDNGFNLDSLNKLVAYGEGTYIDIQPDIFTLVAPGFSGRFYLSGDTAVFLNRNTSYKITMLRGYGFKVTDGRGNTLLYGGDAIEKTRMQAACPIEAHFPNSSNPTAWFLKSIITDARDTVSFFYSNLNYGYTGNINTSNVVDQRAIEVNVGCNCFSEVNYQCTTDMFIESQKLDSVLTSNYARIIFGYDSRPDNISDKLLKNIAVYSTFGPQRTLLRTMRFDYIYGLNKKRPFLSKVANIAGNNSDSMTYILTYNQINNLPDRLDPQTDYWGYYNASTNGNVNPSVSYYGTLAKITYPTGGSDTIYYGSNQLYSQIKNTNWVISSQLHGYGEDDHRCKDYKQIITVYKSSGNSIRVSGQASWQFSGAPDPQLHQENVTIKDLVTGVIYYSKRINPGDLLPYELVSIANAFLGKDSAQLEITMQACGQYLYGNFWVETASITTTDMNLPFAGVRTEKVVSMDRFGKNQTKKYYYNIFSFPNRSSGLPIAYPQFIEEFNTISFCDVQATANCYYKLRHNKSLIDLFAYSNTPMYYSYVTEGYGEDFENGGVRHTFDIRLPVSPSTIWTANTGPQYNNTFYEAPFSILRESTAVESITSHFKKVGNEIKIIKNQEYEYTWPATLQKSRKGYTLRQRIYDNKPQSSANFYTQFDVNSYSYLSSWFAKSKVTETVYTDDNKTMVNEIKYYYDNVPGNNNVSRAEALTSTKDTTRFYYKFANNLKGQQVYDSMIARNIIDPVTEQSEYLNSNLVEKNIISFGFTNGANSIIAPSRVQIQKATYPLENWYTFQQYDSYKNSLERSKDNDINEVYIWGYKHQYPVAKVIGSTYAAAIAFVNQNVIDNPASDQQLRDELKKIKTGLAGTKALITIYTYLPLVGITSETEVNGKITFYEYDSLQRLKLIRNQDGKILKQYDYQYQKPITQ